jgi:hypothetical protein
MSGSHSHRYTAAHPPEYFQISVSQEGEAYEATADIPDDRRVELYWETAMIDVKRLGEGDPFKFDVVVREGKGETRHQVRAPESGKLRREAIPAEVLSKLR